MVQTDNAKLLVVDEYWIANGIEGVLPLAMNRINLLEQTNVLQRQTKKIRDVGQVSDFVGFIAECAVRTERDNAEDAVFAAKRQRDDVLNRALGHATPLLLVLLFLNAEDVIIVLQYPLGPVFFHRNSAMLFQVGFLKPDGGMNDQFCLCAFTFEEPDQSMRSANAFYDVFQNVA